MYQYFVSNPVVAFIFIAIVLVGIIYLLVKKLQNMGLEKIMLLSKLNTIFSMGIMSRSLSMW